MIKIAPYFDEKDIPSIMKEADYQQQLVNLIAKKEKREKIKPSDIKDYSPKGKGIKEKLEIIFNYKCAFCECNTQEGAPNDTEHYRPKKHYYWLAYEWTNFLLSCQNCNRYFKKHRFPLKNEHFRIEKHPLNKNGHFDVSQCHILNLLSENPLLLHPAIDNPLEHLIFTRDGLVKYYTDKGNVSISHYGLMRTPLQEKRLSIIIKIQTFISDVYSLGINELGENERKEWAKTVLSKSIDYLLKKISNPKTTHIAFRTAILNDFIHFIIDNPTLKDKQGKVIDFPDKELMHQAANEILSQ